MLKRIINSEGAMACIAGVLMVPLGAMVIFVPDLFWVIGLSHAFLPLTMCGMVLLGFASLGRSVYLQRHQAGKK